MFVLLEPPSCMGQSACDALWSIRVEGIPKEYSFFLPFGIHRQSSQHQLDSINGFLTLSQLRAWLVHLESEGFLDFVQIFSDTLAAHLASAPTLTWHAEKKKFNLNLSYPRIMGIINVTPDSFSDGGCFFQTDQAVAHGCRLAAEGADILDIGGESTRPGSLAISEQEELDRVIPVIERLVRQVDIPISIDTSKPAVMMEALAAGAAMINDVTALQAFQNHPLGMDVATKSLTDNEIPIILMHMRAPPATMQQAPTYQNVVSEIYTFFMQKIKDCDKLGIGRHRLIIDPGIGFGKTTQHNLELLRHLKTFRGLGLPILLGISRKRFIGELTGIEYAHQRDIASHMLAILCSMFGGADLLRVHDVAGSVQALKAAHGWLRHDNSLEVAD
ncbi:MAG: dihydropteroate synthase [Magnetococcus sp. DMHC-6]